MLSGMLGNLRAASEDGVITDYYSSSGEALVEHIILHRD